MASRTTAGLILLRQALPEDLHSFIEEQPLTANRLQQLMQIVAVQYPERYREILDNLYQLGDEIVSTYGGVASFTPESFSLPPETLILREKLQAELQAIQSSPGLSREGRDKRLVSALHHARDLLQKSLRRGLAGTAFDLQLHSGARGNINQALSLLVGSLLPLDSQGRPIPLPVTRGFAQGLTPSQYWATAQAARLGLIGTKLATPVAGDISNQLVAATTGLRVTEKREPPSRAGLPVDPSDTDYIGSVLARDVPGLAKAGDILTPSLARKLIRTRIGKVLIHSPITSLVEHGISQQAAGQMHGQYPELGAFAGITATQASLEPLTQATISSKHVGKRSNVGLDLIKQLIEVPLQFPGQAAIAREDGRVLSIEPLSTDGKLVTIGAEKYTLAPEVQPLVEKGDSVERGQIFSTGLPNPAQLAKYRGLGDARREFARIFSKALSDSGIETNKRNIEYIARGLINHVRITRPYKQWLPDDLVEFSALTRSYEPREGYKDEPVRAAAGKYLEEPTAHLTIGTQLTRSMAKELGQLGFDRVRVHPEPPPFEPEMRRALEARQHAPDWLGRFRGYYMQRALLDALHSGQAPADPTEPTAIMAQTILRGAPVELKST